MNYFDLACEKARAYCAEHLWAGIQERLNGVAGLGLLTDHPHMSRVIVANYGLDLPPNGPWLVYFCDRIELGFAGGYIGYDENQLPVVGSLGPSVVDRSWKTLPELLSANPSHNLSGRVFTEDGMVLYGEDIHMFQYGRQFLMAVNMKMAKRILGVDKALSLYNDTITESYTKLYFELENDLLTDETTHEILSHSPSTDYHYHPVSAQEKNALQITLNSLEDSDGILMFRNGYAVRPSKAAELLQVNDYIQWTEYPDTMVVLDDIVFNDLPSYVTEVTSLPVGTTNETAGIVHIPKLDNPSNSVVASGDVELQMWKLSDPSVGVRLPDNHYANSLIQLTHNDFAVPRSLWDQLMGLMPDGTIESDVRLRIIVRVFDPYMVLQPCGPRIDMLYSLSPDDDTITSVLTNDPTGTPWTTIPEPWTAAYLETSDYASIINGPYPRNLTAERRKAYIRAVGLFTLAGMLGSVKNYEVSDLSEVLIDIPEVCVDVPEGMTKVDVDVFLFLDGFKVPDDLLTLDKTRTDDRIGVTFNAPMLPEYFGGDYTETEHDVVVVFFPAETVSEVEKIPLDFDDVYIEQSDMIVDLGDMIGWNDLFVFLNGRRLREGLDWTRRGTQSSIGELEFTGNGDYIQLPTAITNSVWSIEIQLTHDSTGPARLSKLLGSTASFNTLFFYYDSPPRIYLKNGNGVLSGAINIALTSDTKQHILLIADGTTLTAYLDGVLADTVAIDTLFRFERFGRANFADDNPDFKGSLHSLRYYSRTLSAPEAVDLVGDVPVDETDLQVYWPIETAVTNVVNDESGNNNHGILYGSNLILRNVHHILDNREQALTTGTRSRILEDGTELEKMSPFLEIYRTTTSGYFEDSAKGHLGFSDQNHPYGGVRLWLGTDGASTYMINGRMRPLSDLPGNIDIGTLDANLLHGRLHQAGIRLPSSIVNGLDDLEPGTATAAENDMLNIHELVEEYRIAFTEWMFTTLSHVVFSTSLHEFIVDMINDNYAAFAADPRDYDQDVDDPLTYLTATQSALLASEVTLLLSYTTADDWRHIDLKPSWEPLGTGTVNEFRFIRDLLHYMQTQLSETVMDGDNWNMQP